jgi:glucose/arabinose dehydrogenase
MLIIGNHFYVVTNEKKDKIYISVGSGSNIAEHGMANEVRRADVLEVGTDGSGEKIYASGLHNPASLGFCFYSASAFPVHYRNGAFIGQHGSWNRSQLAGYKVAFVPFANGRPAGKMEDFLTGFIADPSQNEVYGRQVSVAVMHDGSLLVADDTGNTIWHVSANIK